ncbi:thiamine pyrophosphate-binding protein [Hwanghaeella grinnelliae]|uniref:Thiamine pyrophosphate-binding protein n=1 Tax=Hwanghaeella grinnelliae TaxID=2500179 RepID=A0A437QTN9_9PROT|nr:thiamine pyrophosphate-binding protein [Hwanghaeella grinnelliae]RVU37872.1 thiamine pyrophosphate-binding protein [Hwanghaeella grinnelliae]
MPKTLADVLTDQLAQLGVRRMFGVPGGGSSLDLIDAGARHGIEFILSQTETAGAIMAAVTGELTGTPGVVLTGVGPGAASVVNGTAYASLEKSPLVVFTDQVEGTNAGGIHQKYDQQALFAPLVRSGAALDSETGPGVFAGLLIDATTPPFGPVHVDLSAAQASKPAHLPTVKIGEGTTGDFSVIPSVAKDQIKASRKPVLLVGLEARAERVAIAVHSTAQHLRCPVLTTYKAKGVVPDADPAVMGHVTGGTAEAAVLHAADLILAVGLDPIELINQPWPYQARVIDISEVAHEAGPFQPAAQLVGDPARILPALLEEEEQSGWQASELAALKSAQQARLMPPDMDWDRQPNDPRPLIHAIQQAAPGATLTVDSGAHMFPAMALWQADRPFSVLKSNGLSTMGFAVPAGIAAALHDPGRPVVAITGDGGLSMCLTELATAARLGVTVITVVLNDAALSLIDIKQQAQQRPPLGVRYPTIDYAAAAEALGVKGCRVEGNDAVTAAVGDAMARGGPSLIDVKVDPYAYPEILSALRK